MDTRVVEPIEVLVEGQRFTSAGKPVCRPVPDPAVRLQFIPVRTGTSVYIYGQLATPEQIAREVSAGCLRPNKRT